MSRRRPHDGAESRRDVPSILVANFSRSTDAVAILGRICWSVLRQQSVVREREIATVANHHVIEECNTQKLSRVGYSSREDAVFLARRRIARGVMVNNDQTGGI